VLRNDNLEEFRAAAQRRQAAADQQPRRSEAPAADVAPVAEPGKPGIGLSNA